MIRDLNSAIRMIKKINWGSFYRYWLLTDCTITGYRQSNNIINSVLSVAAGIVSVVTILTGCNVTVIYKLIYNNSAVLKTPFKRWVPVRYSLSTNKSHPK